MAAASKVIVMSHWAGSPNQTSPDEQRLSGLVYWLVFVNLIQARAIWKEGTSVEKMSTFHQPIDKSLGHFLDWWLMGEGEGPAPPWAVPPGQIVLDSVRKKKSVQSVSSKPVNHIPLWSRLRFFPPGACPDFSQRQMITWEVQDEINPALSGLLLVTVFITERESKLEQLVISKMKATKLRERWMTGASSVIPHFLTTAVLTLSGPN